MAAFRLTGRHSSRGPRVRWPAGSQTFATGLLPDMTCRVTFVQTHPVQYMAPFFRFVAAQRPEFDLTVLYASTPLADQQGVGFGESFVWMSVLPTGIHIVFFSRLHLAVASTRRAF